MEGRKAPPEMRQSPTCRMEVTTQKKTVERLPHMFQRFSHCHSQRALLPSITLTSL